MISIVKMLVNKDQYSSLIETKGGDYDGNSNSKTPLIVKIKRILTVCIDWLLLRYLIYEIGSSIKKIIIK